MTAASGTLLQAASPRGRASSSGVAAVGSKRISRPRLFQKHRCQANGCPAHLGELSFYHQRNHICSEHLKAESFLVGDLLSRFCQRCGLSHPLGDFEGKRKSCRKALEKYSARRKGREAEGEGAAAAAAARGGVVQQQQQGQLPGGSSSVTMVVPSGSSVVLPPAILAQLELLTQQAVGQTHGSGTTAASLAVTGEPPALDNQQAGGHNGATQQQPFIVLQTQAAPAGPAPQGQQPQQAQQQPQASLLPADVQQALSSLGQALQGLPQGAAAVGAPPGATTIVQVIYIIQHHLPAPSAPAAGDAATEAAAASASGAS